MDTIKTIIVLWLVFDAGFLAGLFWAAITRQNDPESRLHRKGEKGETKCHLPLEG